MEITVKNEKVNLKRDYITNGEVNYIISEVLKIYNEEGDIEGFGYNHLSMVTNFYALLFSLCIEGYDIDKIEDYDKYYNLGTQYELLKVVTNAEEAYHLMMSLSKQVVSVENIIDKNLNNLVNLIMEKIPDAKTMSKMVDKLPKEWKDVIAEHNKIVGKEQKEDDE